ncbi:MAG: hypothetical protein IIB17_11075 [Chloroflexi bacterium]|nr:hypothetical protein [Chloroflexota bacterium]
MLEHPVLGIRDAVEQTHPGLGNLAAMALVAAKARQCLLVVAPPGTGKSTVGAWLDKVHPEAYIRDSLTRSSLVTYQTLFNDFTGLVIFDDVGKIDTDHSRLQTLVTMAELVHGHFISKSSFQLNIEISNFQGAALLNIQPNILKSVIEDATWHSNLADKTLRYYHLKRALSPNRQPIEADADWGINIEDVGSVSEDSAVWRRLYELGIQQWTRPRAIEHIEDLIKGVAALGSNPLPDETDMEVLEELLRPMCIESEILEKKGFGDSATMNANLLYLLVEFATYPVLTYGQMGEDYHMKPRQVTYILEQMHEYFEKVGENPVTIQPTAELIKLLKKAGLR